MKKTVLAVAACTTSFLSQRTHTIAHSDINLSELHTKIINLLAALRFKNYE